MESSEKGADKVTAQDVCNDNIKIMVNSVVDAGENSLDVYLENVRSFPISDFVIRLESDGDEVEVKKVPQVVGGYESVILNVKKPSFSVKTVKVIPRIVLAKPEITSMVEGWWLCSEQLAKYELF